MSSGYIYFIVLECTRFSRATECIGIYVYSSPLVNRLNDGCRVQCIDGFANQELFRVLEHSCKGRFEGLFALVSLVHLATMNRINVSRVSAVSSFSHCGSFDADISRRNDAHVIAESAERYLILGNLLQKIRTLYKYLTGFAAVIKRRL